MCNKHRIVVCDDQQKVRGKVREILNLQADLEVVGEAPGGLSGIAVSLDLLPDLVLMDVRTPDMDGFEATRQIVTKAPRVIVLAHSSVSTWETVDQMFTAGARGYVLKGDGGELLRAVRTVLAGGSFLSPALMGSKTLPEEES